jgi:hypothetical protein
MGRGAAALAMVLAAQILGGCAVTPLMAWGAVEEGALTSTKKLLPDHIASAIVGRDCSAISLTETGEYCPTPVEVDRSNLYCVRTLGDVNCYEKTARPRNVAPSVASPPPVFRSPSPSAAARLAAQTTPQTGPPTWGQPGPPTVQMAPGGPVLLAPLPPSPGG